jgi:hypothetical protein
LKIVHIKMLKLISVFLGTLLLSSCQSSFFNSELPENARHLENVQYNKELLLKYEKLQKEQEETVQQLQKLEAAINSLKDSIGREMSDKVSVAKKKRSGLKSAPLQETSNDRDAHSWMQNAENVPPEAGFQNESPGDLYQSALDKYEKGAPGEALLSLLRLHQQFPLRPDSGASKLLEAKCYLKIKDFRKSIASVKFLKLNFAQSDLLAEALLVQADAHKKLREFGLASATLKDVVALNASSLEAKTARAEMARLREAQSQRTFIGDEDSF